MVRLLQESILLDSMAHLKTGTPYIVARIIEFLQPLTTPKKSSRLGPSELSVRLSLYYRPSDVSFFSPQFINHLVPSIDPG